jgi:hypothetical protein
VIIVIEGAALMERGVTERGLDGARPPSAAGSAGAFAGRWGHENICRLAGKTIGGEAPPNPAGEGARAPFRMRPLFVPTATASAAHYRVALLVITTASIPASDSLSANADALSCDCGSVRTSVSVPLVSMTTGTPALRARSAAATALACTR